MNGRQRDTNGRHGRALMGGSGLPNDDNGMPMDAKWHADPC